ncbi:MAG TPA: hypothetical protein VLM85_06460 [Polyangiaceae bacterium]|nr:hypothetical protein [Polyangiaceae bacterium]
MLAPDVRLEGFTAEDWARLLDLFKPRHARPETPRPRGGLLLVHGGGRIRKLLHTRLGRLEPGGAWPSIPPEGGLAKLAGEHEASWAVAAEVGALDEVMERFGARARRSDDLVVQTLTLVHVVRELMHQGQIEGWPRRLRNVPVPTEPMVRRAIDSVCGDGRAIALGVFRGGELWTALVARRRGRGFDLLAGPDELRPAMGLLSGEWRRDYRHLVQAVEDRYAPLALGCFAEASVLAQLQVDGRPGAWSRAIAVRDVVVSPMPAAVGVALGYDSARYAWTTLRAVAPSLGPLAVLEPALVSLRKRAAELTDNDIAGVLGFSPLALLRALLQRDHRGDKN